jgi:predicted nucleotidyltransferase
MPTLAEVFAAIEQLQPELRKRHVRRIGVFGSVARGEARIDSDVDVLVELTDEADLLDLVAIKRLLETSLRSSVDVVPTGGLKPDVREAILREVRYAA